MIAVEKLGTSGRNGPTVRRKALATYVVDNMGLHKSIVIRQIRHIYRVLVDTGTELWVIHKRVYSVLNPKILNRDICLQTAIDDQARLQVKTGSQLTLRNFYVVRNLNSNIILGRISYSKMVLEIISIYGHCLRHEYVALEKRQAHFVHG